MVVLFQPASCNKEYQMFGTFFPVRALVGGYNTLNANLCKVCTSRFVSCDKFLSNTCSINLNGPMRTSQCSCRHPLKQPNKQNLECLTREQAKCQ